MKGDQLQGRALPKVSGFFAFASEDAILQPDRVLRGTPQSEACVGYLDGDHGIRACRSSRAHCISVTMGLAAEAAVGDAGMASLSSCWAAA